MPTEANVEYLLSESSTRSSTESSTGSSRCFLDNDSSEGQEDGQDDNDTKTISGAFRTMKMIQVRNKKTNKTNQLVLYQREPTVLWKKTIRVMVSIQVRDKKTN